MEALILALSPLAVVLITQGVKKIKAVKRSDNRKAWIRIGALVFSFVAVVGNSVVNGNEISPLLIEEFAKTIAIFAGTQVPYMFGKSSEKEKELLQ